MTVLSLDRPAGAVEEKSRAEGLRARFASAHGVRPFKNTRRNVGSILRSGGAAGADVIRVLDRVGQWGAHHGPFDHGEVWGELGRPRVLVGHPYGLDGEGAELLDAIALLGLEVRTGGESYYGFGTDQVLVFARRPSVADECRRRRSCRVGLPGLRMRHVATGREFVCLGSLWTVEEDLRLQVLPGERTTRGDVVASIARRLGEGTPKALRAVEDFDRFGLVCAADLRVGPPPESFDATECILLGRWRVTCCRPSRAGPRRQPRGADRCGGRRRGSRRGW